MQTNNIDNIPDMACMALQIMPTATDYMCSSNKSGSGEPEEADGVVAPSMTSSEASLGEVRHDINNTHPDAPNKSGAASSTASKNDNTSNARPVPFNERLLTSVSSLEAEIDLLGHTSSGSGASVSNTSPRQTAMADHNLQQRSPNINPRYDSRRGTAHFMDIVATNEREQEKQRRKEQGLLGGTLHFLPFLSASKDDASGRKSTAASSPTSQRRSASSTDEHGGVRRNLHNMARTIMLGLDQETEATTSTSASKQHLDRPKPLPYHHSSPNADSVSLNRAPRRASTGTFLRVEPRLVQPVDPYLVERHDRQHQQDDEQHQDKLEADIAAIEEMERVKAAHEKQAKIASDISEIESQGLTNARWHQAVQGGSSVTTAADGEEDGEDGELGVDKRKPNRINANTA